MKKYENKSNTTGNLIQKVRLEKKMSKADVIRKLELHAVYLDPTELYRMETGKMIIKDFELLALRKVLNIDIKELDNTIL